MLCQFLSWYSISQYHVCVTLSCLCDSITSARYFVSRILDTITQTWVRPNCDDLVPSDCRIYFSFCGNFVSVKASLTGYIQSNNSNTRELTTFQKILKIIAYLTYSTYFIWIMISLRGGREGSQVRVQYLVMLFKTISDWLTPYRISLLLRTPPSWHKDLLYYDSSHTSFHYTAQFFSHYSFILKT